MKKIVLLLALALSTTFGMAQTEKGGYVIGNVTTNNVSRENQIKFGVAPEIGIFGERLGVSAVYNRSLNLEKGSKVSYHNPKAVASSYGLKLYGKLLEYEGLNLFLTAELSRYDQKIDKKVRGQFEGRPGAMIAARIIKGVDARFGYSTLIYKQDFGGEVGVYKYKHGASFGIAAQLW